ncbi:pyrroloquinoline quinone precursor peptide PqqA [Extensimonas sp. H3M7-6]|uniref:pyrroloquinoline quinone precursor peptide PqqA n=1 Tax=Extensimonas soli TaxID=3031322 RepID=UPI00387E922A
MKRRVCQESRLLGIIPRKLARGNWHTESVPSSIRRIFVPPNLERSITMQWEKPAAINMRFGFEITMYIAVR